MKIEVYENNGGGLTLVIIKHNEVVGMYYGFEYGGANILTDAIGQLIEDDEAYKQWDGDLLEITMEEWPEVTLDKLYDMISIDTLIAEVDENNIITLYTNSMGTAAMKSFGLE